MCGACFVMLATEPFLSLSMSLHFLVKYCMYNCFDTTNLHIAPACYVKPFELMCIRAKYVILPTYALLNMCMQPVQFDLIY